MDLPADIQMNAWTAMLCAMPIPGALVSSSGNIVAVNRWLDAEPGDKLLQPEIEGSGALRFGVDNSRWRVRPVEADGSVLLATMEREDVGDHLLRKFFSSNEALFVVYDQAGRIIESNSAWEDLLGYSSDEVFGLDSWTLLPPEDLVTRGATEAELREDGRSDPTFLMRTASGDYRLVQWNLHFDFSVGRCFGIGRDVTEEDRQATELQRKAYTDELTGLANRAKLIDHLDELMTHGAQRPALLFCDLDHFKVVNDSLGHTVGDHLLRGLADRLTETLADEEGVMIARLGGDEFVVLIDYADQERALRVANAILWALKKPILVEERKIHASMSVGVSTCEHGCSTLELLSHADTAVYEAKRIGRGVPVLFDDLLQARANRRFHVEADLRDAIDNGQVVSYFQPMVDLSSGEIVAAEALMRWQTTDGEVLAPQSFLDVAIDAGLVPEIDSQLLGEVLTAAGEVSAKTPSFSISLNTTQDQLLNEGYVDLLLAETTKAGLRNEQVIIEIVESAVISTTRSLPVLEELRACGFKIALDDFGTGFSSLSHLRDLPIDIVKVDRSFVESLTDDDVASALTKSLIDMAGALELMVIMEGIETEQQECAVADLGANIVQGYRYFSPMPKHEFLSLWPSIDVEAA